MNRVNSHNGVAVTTENNKLYAFMYACKYSGVRTT